MCRFLKRCIGCCLVTHTPVKRDIVGRCFMQGFAARLKIHLCRQFVIIQHNQFSCITRLGQRICNHSHNRLTNKTQAILGQHRTAGRGALASITVLYKNSSHF